MDDKVRNMVDVRDVADALVLTYATKVSEMVSIVRNLHPNLNYPRK